MNKKEEISFKRLSGFDALYDASYRVCRNVRWKDSTTNFEESRIEKIIQTQEDLRNDEYRQLVFSCFSIIERGKPRDIRACHIDDRLVQSALTKEYLLPELTPKFIHDNCATLKRKGIDFALKRFKKHFQSAHKEFGLGKDFYCLRIDIRKYFDSIDHTALKEIASKVITDPDVLRLVHYFVDTFVYKVTKDEEPIPGKQYYIAKDKQYIPMNIRKFLPNRNYYEYTAKSLGLGSETSQLLALLTLNGVDHFIKEQLHVKYYGRYMDDLYLLHNDSQYLNYCKQEIEKKVAEVGLMLNQNKTTISRVHPIGKDGRRGAPIKYLKWDFYITSSNHVIMNPFKKKISHQRRKLRKMH